MYCESSSLLVSSRTRCVEGCSEQLQASFCRAVWKQRSDARMLEPQIIYLTRRTLRPGGGRICRVALLKPCAQQSGRTAQQTGQGCAKTSSRHPNLCSQSPVQRALKSRQKPESRSRSTISNLCRWLKLARSQLFFLLRPWPLQTSGEQCFNMTACAFQIDDRVTIVRTKCLGSAMHTPRKALG